MRMKLLHRWFPNKFPNEKVQELISELDKLDPLFQSHLAFRTVKDQVKKFFIDNQDEILKQWNELPAPRAYCLFTMGSLIRDDVHTRRYHFREQIQYESWLAIDQILDMPGRYLVDVWTTSAKELVKIGAITKEKYQKVGRDFSLEIRWATDEDEKRWKERPGWTKAGKDEEDEEATS